MKKKTIRVIIKEPGEQPRMAVVENELTALQKAVGGYIETVTFGRDWTVLCDEEGRLYHKPWNCKLCGVDFVGTILLVGVKGDRFTDFGITMEEMRQLFPHLF